MPAISAASRSAMIVVSTEPYLRPFQCSMLAMLDCTQMNIFSKLLVVVVVERYPVAFPTNLPGT